MARKTAYELQHIKLEKPKGNDKNTKQRAWQYLFENKNKAFSATYLGKVLEVHRTTVKEALELLMEEKPIIEQSKEYKVYKIDSSYRVLDKKEYEKYKSEQKKDRTIEDRITEEACALYHSKIWTSNKSETVPAIVIFYPMDKNTIHYNKVKISLNKLFGEYIIAILEGKKEGKNGIYIILKKHKDIFIVKKHIEDLYGKITTKKEK